MTNSCVFIRGVKHTPLQAFSYETKHFKRTPLQACSYETKHYGKSWFALALTNDVVYFTLFEGIMFTVL